MEITAKSKSVRISPRKVRLVADNIRNLPLSRALEVLSVTQKRGASVLAAVMKSAIANASQGAKKDTSDLVVKGIEVWEGPAMKRYHASTRGRVHPFKKRSSHVKITLTDNKNEEINSVKEEPKTEDTKKGEKHGTKS